MRSNINMINSVFTISVLCSGSTNEIELAKNNKKQQIKIETIFAANVDILESI